MMNGIVRHVVKKITGNKTGKERSHVNGANQSTEKKIKKSCQRNTYCRHHDQPFAVARIIVMHAMKDKMNASADFAIPQTADSGDVLVNEIENIIYK